MHASLQALKADIEDLAKEAKEANADSRIVAFLEKLAAQIPDTPPTHTDIFRLGHKIEAVHGYLPTAAAEWSPVLAAQFSAIALGMDRTVRKSPEWMAFIAADATAAVTAEATELAPAKATELANELETGPLNDVVGPSIIEALYALAQDDVFSGFAPDSAAARQLAADIYESISNIFKGLLEPIARMSGSGVRLAAGLARAAAGSKAAKAAKSTFDDELSKQTDRLVRNCLKNIRRFVEGGLFVGLPGYLASHYFGWLQPVLDALQHIPWLH